MFVFISLFVFSEAWPGGAPDYHSDSSAATGGGGEERRQREESSLRPCERIRTIAAGLRDG